MGNFVDRIWELGSWRREEGLGKGTQVDRKGRRQAKDFGVTEPGSSCSWLLDEVGHRKALYDRIGGHKQQG
jgi:hypothetical protein